MTPKTQNSIHYDFPAIKNAGNAFISESQSYLKGMKVFGSNDPGAIQIPSGGNAIVDHTLGTVLGMVYDTHQLIGGAMSEHGSKIHDAILNITSADEATIELIYQRLGGALADGSSGPSVDPPNMNNDGTYPDYLGTRLHEPAYRPMPTFAPLTFDPSPSLPPIQRNFVGGDPQGLTRFAWELKHYVLKQGDATFNFLKNTVEALVKNDPGDDGYHASPDGGWVGHAAYSFRNAFISDAASMNGLHQVICKVASIIDGFASDLASAELAIEQTILSNQSSVLSHLGMPTVGTANLLQCFSGDRVDGTQRITLSSSLPPATGSSSFERLLTDVNALATPFFSKVEVARHTTASRLAGQGEVLLSGIHYYEKHATNFSSGANAFVSSSEYDRTTGAHTKYQPDLDTLSNNLVNYQRELNMSGSEQAAIMSDLKNMGISADQVGTILNDIKDYRGAEGALAKTGGMFTFFKDVLPLLAMVGLEAI